MIFFFCRSIVASVLVVRLSYTVAGDWVAMVK